MAKENGASKILMGMNPFNEFRTAGFKEMYHEWLELVDAQEELNGKYIETEDRIKILRGEIETTDEALQKSTDGVKAQKESRTGAGEEVDRAAQKYVDLGVKMREFDGDIKAISESFTEEEEALKTAFRKHCRSVGFYTYRNHGWSRKRSCFTFRLHGEMAGV